MSRGSGKELRAAAELRREFDSSFAVPRARALVETEAILVLLVSGNAYAVRLADVAGLHVDRPITHLPSTSAAFLGVVGLQGRIVPALSLSVLLSHPREESHKWLISTGPGGGVGLAFGGLEGHFRVPREGLSPDTVQNTGERHLRGAVAVEGRTIPLLDVGALAPSLAPTPSRDPIIVREAS